jgi:hypothetical protein
LEVGALIHFSAGDKTIFATFMTAIMIPQNFQYRLPAPYFLLPTCYFPSSQGMGGMAAGVL